MDAGGNRFGHYLEVSVKTTFKETLLEKGIIFCSFSEAVREHPDLVKKYLGSVVGPRDNFFAALNSAVFSDGSFVYIPKGVRCPMELSTYFRINAANTGQFERTISCSVRNVMKVAAWTVSCVVVPVAKGTRVHL